ncbi:MAG: rhodanese-like domain-containing protein [Gammaproteobacteria bacterium]
MNKTIFLTIILVAVSLVIASLMFVMSHPTGLRLSEADIGMLAQQIVRGEDHVTVAELSDRIIKAQGDYILIDLRPEDQYEERHIDSARHIPLSELVKPDVLAGLPRDKAVIVYSSSTTNAAQAAVILRLSGIPAYSLVGGYNYWAAYMTDPAAAGIAEHDAHQRARYDAIRCFLEGDYVAEAGLVVKQPATAGFTPPLQAVEETVVEDPLGLGLGIDIEFDSGSDADTGLGPGLGGGDAPAGLRIGEGC